MLLKHGTIKLIMVIKTFDRVMGPVIGKTKSKTKKEKKTDLPSLAAPVVLTLSTEPLIYSGK